MHLGFIFVCFQDSNSSINIPKLRLLFNPVVLCFSFVTIATLVSAVVLMDHLVPAELGQWFDWVVETWTWFHVVSRDVMIIFFVFLFFSRFADIKLSNDEDEVEFSTLTWFAMVFGCGASLHLFYFSVSDPISNYDPRDGSNRYLADPYLADNSLAQIAITLTFYHYGNCCNTFVSLRFLRKSLSL